jgi:hypothetical protein
MDRPSRACHDGIDELAELLEFGNHGFAGLEPALWIAA